MAGLTDQAGGRSAAAQARQAWQDSMEQHLDRLRPQLRQQAPQVLAQRSGSEYRDGSIHLTYWDQAVRIQWPDLLAFWADTGEPCSSFDNAMLLYYLNAEGGAPVSNRWIGFRELPNGAFYNQAFQGYSGDPLGKTFGDRPAGFHDAAQTLGGRPIQGMGEYAYAFRPLPRILMAAVLWPGDEDFPTRAQVLFDASASRYMITDGLAILGSGLARRLEKALR
jgi:hypothetical protein